MPLKNIFNRKLVYKFTEDQKKKNKPKINVYYNFNYK